jgi:lysyl-tRNA synthetase class 1
MQWLNRIVDEVVSRHPDGEIIVSSGVSPSGTYHLGTLREVLTAEVIMRELTRRGRSARHLHIVDDLDVFRKVPVDVPDNFSEHLGKPLCDVPAPDGSKRSYADFFLADLLTAAEGLHLELEVVRAHERYRSGEVAPAIEKSLENIPAIRQDLESISGRQLEEQWTPVQVVENGRLKNREFISIDSGAKTIEYKDADGQIQTANYQMGEVKLSWRIDWPARWWQLAVDVEPFGRDHATKGGSYDTGAAIVTNVFGADAPYPVPYNFINRTGDTKKMSKSAGDTITAADLLTILPAELVWYFMLRYGPEKLLFFDTGDTLVRLFDEFAELLAKPDKTEGERQLLDLCLQGVTTPTVSRVPFTHLVASYQASLRKPEQTMAIITRTEHADIVARDEATITAELRFIENWLDREAPDEVKFALRESVSGSDFTDAERAFFNGLAEEIVQAPADADGAWFHDAIYKFKTDELGPKQLFQALYRLIIDKDSGPRAGWFLSILPRDWLIDRLRLSK